MAPANQQMEWTVMAGWVGPTGAEESKSKHFAFGVPDAGVINCNATFTFRPDGEAHTFGFSFAWKWEHRGPEDSDEVVAACDFEIKSSTGDPLGSGGVFLKPSKHSTLGMSPLRLTEGKWTDQVTIILRISFT
jgi:hypothetical protein